MKNEELDGDSFTLEGNLDVCIILVHGFTSTTAEVRPIAETLNAYGYTMFCPLLPGHNTSPKELNTKLWSDWTNSVKKILENAIMNFSKVYIGGESMGGLIACYLASYYYQIEGIILYSPALIVPGLNWSHFIRFIRPYIDKSSNNRINNTEIFPWKGYKVNPTRAAYQLYILQSEVKKRLTDISQPIIIFQGKKDLTVDPYGAEYIYNNVKSRNKQLILMENSGHCIILDQEFQDVVNETKIFLSKNY
jgi:carboxylesterase